MGRESSETYAGRAAAAALVSTPEAIQAAEQAEQQADVTQRIHGRR